MTDRNEDYKFFIELRKYIIKFEDKNKLAPYYEALLQTSINNQMKLFLNECEVYDFSIDYTEEDEEDHYSDGMFEIRFHDFNISHAFMIHLNVHDDSSGYCECTPNMIGYNVFKGCCGIICDTTFPSVEIIKEENIISHSYSGYAKDLWNDLDKWNDDHDKEFKEKERLEKVETLKSRMQRLQDEIDLLERM